MFGMITVVFLLKAFRKMDIDLNTIVFFDSQRKQLARMAHGGFLYNMGYEAEDHTIWRCEQLSKDWKCPGMAHFVKAFNTVQLKRDHNHLADHPHVQAELRKVIFNSEKFLVYGV